MPHVHIGGRCTTTHSDDGEHRQVHGRHRFTALALRRRNVRLDRVCGVRTR
jgi:hypothetical protein